MRKVHSGIPLPEWKWNRLISTCSTFSTRSTYSTFQKKIHLRGARDHVRLPIPLTPLAKCLNLIGFWGRLSAQLWLVGERAASALPSGGGNCNSTHTFVSGSGNLISTSTFAFLRDHAQDSTHTQNSVHFHSQSGD